MNMIYVIAGLLVALGLLSKGAGDKSKDAEIGEQVAYLVGNRITSLGALIFAISLYMNGHVIIASIPALVAIKGIMFDCFNTGRLREMIQDDI